MQRPVFVVLAVLAWLLPAMPALAHAVLVESVPADGAFLAAPPDEIRLRFNEPVTLVALQVIDSTGRTVATHDAAAVAGTAIVVALPATEGEGSWLVSYRLTSLDSHPVAGTIGFTVGEAGGPAAAAAPSGAGSAWEVAYMISRALFTLALTVAAGGVLFLFVVGAGESAFRRIARRIRAAAVVAIACGAVSLVFKSAALAGAAPHDLLDPATWALGAATTLGTSLAVAAGALAVLAAVPVGRGGWWLVIAAAAALAGVASFVLTGHATAATLRGLTGSALALHVLMVAFWVGALWCLLVVLRGSASLADAAAGVRRFSRRAVPAVAMLLAAGVVLAVVQVESWSGLVERPYGWILLVKVGLVAGLLGLAAHNKLRLLPVLVRGNAGAAARLARAVRLEIAVVAAILLATAGLGSVPPPRASAAGAPAVAVQAQGVAATVQLTPGVAGRNVLSLALADPAGRPLEAQAVTIALSRPQAGIEALRRDAARLEAGRYEVPDLALPVRGRWQLRIDVLVSDFEKAILSTEIEVR